MPTTGTTSVSLIERIRWLRPIIEHCTDGLVKVWENQRRGETRVCLWLECCDFLVILTGRKGYPAYPVVYPHQRGKLQKEYKAYKMADAALD
jgi:IS1 family transposase